MQVRVSFIHKDHTLVGRWFNVDPEQFLALKKLLSSVGELQYLQITIENGEEVFVPSPLLQNGYVRLETQS